MSKKTATAPAAVETAPAAPPVETAPPIWKDFSKKEIVEAVKAIRDAGGDWSEAYKKAQELGYKSKQASLKVYVYPVNKGAGAKRQAKKAEQVQIAKVLNTPAAKPTGVEDTFKALIRSSLKEILQELIAAL